MAAAELRQAEVPVLAAQQAGVAVVVEDVVVAVARHVVLEDAEAVGAESCTASPDADLRSSWWGQPHPTRLFHYYGARSPLLRFSKE